MAAKKAKTTRKYRQAKTAAKAAAKEAFPGKKQAVKRDPKLKISAEDRMIAKEVSDQAKADLGKNAYLKKSDYEATQKAAREKFRSEMRAEFGEYGGKKAGETDVQAPKRTPKTKAPAAKNPVSENAKKLNKTRTFVTAVETPSQTEKVKPSVKKKSVTKKPAATKAAPSKPSAPAPAKAATAPKVSKSAANKAAWAKMTPEERRNWKTTRPGAATAEAPAAMPKQSTKETPKNTKPTMSKAEMKQQTQKAMDNLEDSINRAKRPTDASLRANEDAYLKQTKARLEAKKPAATTAPKTTKPKAEAPKPAAKKVAVKKPSTLKKLGKFAGKAIKYGAIGSEVGSIVKGSTEKDWKEIQRLENKLAEAKGQKPRYKNMGSNKNPIQAMTADASHMANLLSLGLVGQTRRQRMDQLNRAINKAGKKPAASKPAADKTSYVATSQAGKKYLSPSHMAQNKKNVTISGGATTKYTVKKGDTLSGIAKNSGLSLSEVRKLNPELMNNPKYKKGSMIWSGTKVNIKKK